MSALSIQPTYPIFTDIDGQPLEDGYIWIGTANLDPQTNPINVYWDAALTLPAAQPIRTLAGYPSNSGTPARLYVNSDYSIRVMNKNGSTVYSAPAATERYSNVVTNIDLFTSASFGVVGDGVTDDTLAMLDAWDYCRTNNKTLLISGSIRILASSVPPGGFHNTFYVYASSMLAINEAELLVEGKIGFDLTGVDQTLLQGFKVTTTGRQMTENELESSSPFLFRSDIGSKSSAVYRDLIVYHNVTSTDGQYRAGKTFVEYGCAAVEFDNIKVSNSTMVIQINQSDNIVVRNVFGYNIQTNLYFSVVNNYQVTNCHYINTQQQADYWVQRTNATPRNIAGFDNLLVEQGDNGTVIGLHGEWIIERNCYIQSSNVHISDCYTRNSDGYKLVGNSYTNQVKNHYIQNCHVLIDDTWVSTRGRIQHQLLTSYWASEVHVYGCSITNTVQTRTNVAFAITFGRSDGSTSENLYVKDCQAINAARLVFTFLTTLTSAQLAALSPAGSFVSCRNVIIENSYISHNSFGVPGSLFDIDQTGASADALANIAVENVNITNNVIFMTTSTAIWLFQPRWCDGVTSTNNFVNREFSGSFYSSAVAAPYANIRMNEPFLKNAQNVGVMINRLANLTVLSNSNLTFTGILNTTQTIITASTYETSTLLNNRVVAEIFGKGYLQVNTTNDYAIEMTAKGDFYFGKVIGGVKTDQVSTPPVGISLAAGIIAYDGNLQPTVDYYVKMTLV